jgi:rRNA processing protein Gar1
MKKKHQYLLISILCFIIATACAVVYGIVKLQEVRIISAAGFAGCAAVCIRMFIDFLKEIGFGKKVFGPLRKFFAKIYKEISDKLKYLAGKDEDKIFIGGKKDQFQIKFELFKPSKDHSEKKAKTKLPKYSSLKTEKEKIRYIYTVFLKKKVERGYKLNTSRTPEEIGEDFAGNEKIRALFDAYPIARYADENEPIGAESKDFEDII